MVLGVQGPRIEYSMFYRKLIFQGSFRPRVLINITKANTGFLYKILFCNTNTLTVLYKSIVLAS